LKWLRRAYRHCIEWVWSRFWPPGLILRSGKVEPATSWMVSTGPNARIETTMWIRQETPPGIARLAAILSECARDTSISSGGGLAGRPARDA
jgi:hypothetical protein